ncbi:putative peptide methionine sulfoxide reductase msrB [Toxoplasma gondii TgCatPRC2]|uniref:Peptide-methionine (R)-S-oxide reductase n=11 Tax=Toxoplasma gondii TaxID=5811 RepID=A0A125YGC0_TOXGV|nr:peptide methionine sulfoxide reductase msrB, putative [Toxoplasma gondii ME49]ESS35209.1 putative peptide methionine sulfoxide reductase msrB [Toxoplasma gondii VEG]KFG37582.1 putative peptide methionine sulfoxide reductase msrB [Toxoplasma gondii GAB2-2007-GAL-DOM2]KFG56195.1 putative peptide methionine sulfoxide reductase msrB [Toxoplasma gondii FOU]KFG66193.1 putative peptide methionine sulfoxide reductase msrB [Toxoplasma gondii RUB]KFH17718.1 putative peptide methionine sulfoxide reduc|eukprot:XP_018635390.1 peptide methionine sulfoxide reductase msrB, putative [Toxoplasma gondii ME49]
MPSFVPSIGLKLRSLFRSISPHRTERCSAGDATQPEAQTDHGKGLWKRRWYSSGSSSTTFSQRTMSVPSNEVPAPPRGPNVPAKTEVSRFPSAKTDAQWKVLLTPEQFRVLRKKGTETPGTGYYNKLFPTKGYFACAACRHPLFPASAKFASGCGWPAFDRFFRGSVYMEEDNSFGMKRVEIVCANCGGHLGHLFEGEGFTATNERHCVNSVSIRYIEEGKAIPSSAVTTYKQEKAKQHHHK